MKKAFYIRIGLGKLIYFLTIAFVLASCNNIKTHDVYTNPNLPSNKRAQLLLAQMTLEEKIGQMVQLVGLKHIEENEQWMKSHGAEVNHAFGFYPGYSPDSLRALTRAGQVGSFLHVLTPTEANALQSEALKSRLKIPLLIGIDAIHGNAMVNGTTVYPSPIGLAATWDTVLVQKIARETREEMWVTGSHWTFSPNLDIARDARWGRVGETFGEDPLLVSLMGRAMVKGYEIDTIDGTRKVLSCIKHFVAGSQSVNGVNVAPTDISELTLHEIFLPPYQACINLNPSTLMLAHNEINGVPCHAHQDYIQNILKKEYGFNGFIVSDWMDVKALKKFHQMAANDTNAVELSVNAGLDMNMHGPEFGLQLKYLVEKDFVPMERINDAAYRIIKAKFELGLFETCLVDETKVDESIFTEEHQQTALEAARKSVVLLKNNGILPLQSNKYKHILVVGPNANNQSILGDWALLQPNENITTILEGFQQELGSKISYYDVGSSAKFIAPNVIANAVQKAKQSDLVVMVVGENSLRYTGAERTAGENMARDNINMPGNQMDFAQAMLNSKKPVVCILVSGRPLGIANLIEKSDAVINALEPGAKGGQAVAEICVGKVNPSGKLPLSIPRNAGQIQTVYNHKPSHYVLNYILTETGPLFPFGYGLSYTTFEFREIALSKNIIEKGESIKATVKITNTGKVMGDEVVQFYLNDNACPVTQPVKKLIGFKKVSLQIGESKTIEFMVKPDMLSYLNTNLERVTDAGSFTLMVGSSLDDKDLQKIQFELK